MERQGFLQGSRFDWSDGALETWMHPTQRGVENCEVQTALGVAYCVGPLWYRGHFGKAALGLLLDDVSATGRVDETELRGNFALFLRTQNHCLLMNDALALVRLYASQDGLFYSTSWLATCAYAGGVELDEAAAAEYVLLGAAHSDQTVAAGVRTLPLARTVDLTEKRLRERLRAGIWDEDSVPVSFDAAADQICSYLQTVCREVAEAFPGRTSAALSGGFDSRLIVAGLLASSERPDLFVYGDAKSEDVVIARMVADGTRLSLKIVDKAVMNRQMPTLDLEHLVQSSLFFDGLPNDGICDPGADRQTRLEQTAGGRIALNGGGGEIFRNFFHLPDRPLRPLDIVRTFYRGFDPRVFRRPDGLASYQDNLVSSIARALGMDETSGRRTLTRAQVELIYPLFRCHHWMGVNNSLATRHGYYSTPLVDLTLIRQSFSLPLAWKNAGRLESHLVTKLHRGVASQPSTYGFCFSDGPDWRAHLTEWTTCMRPVLMRPFINAARRRLRKQGVAHDVIARCRSLLPGEWRLDPVLDLERLPDDSAFARAFSVEVAWRELIG
jgi:asparagine synthase (glutamine-hydrolysing)